MRRFTIRTLTKLTVCLACVALLLIIAPRAHGQDGAGAQMMLPVIANQIGARAVSAGSGHTCALTTGGGIRCWGMNQVGQLGDGTTSDRSVAAEVSGLASGAVAVSARGFHTCALTAAGGVKCWGANDAGQLGDGTTTHRSVPTDVKGLGQGVRALSAGGGHVCALTAAGGVKCWGLNDDGQLGDGTTTNRLTPVDVRGLDGVAVAIAAGAKHTCALTAGGGAKCWGDNGAGQLGVGTTESHRAPVDVFGLGSGVSAISAGTFHTCALTTDGAARCWGNNRSGELGSGEDCFNSACYTLTPVAVVGPGNRMVSISAGSEHTCAIGATGGAYCWGNNVYGRLGDGTNARRVAPVAVVGLSAGVVAVSAGSAHTCALTIGGRLMCWGDNRFGSLGDASPEDARYAPAPIAWPEESTVSAVSSGGSHTCALTTARDVLCWGANGYGQVGNGTISHVGVPTRVFGVTGSAVAIATGLEHSCALTEAGGVMCWGRNSDGQLGDGTTNDRWTAVGVDGLSSGVLAISAGRQHTCAVVTGGGVKCWGANHLRQLGDGTTIDRLAPVDVGLPAAIQAVAAGAVHTCALDVGGGVMCWGDNNVGTLGVGAYDEHRSPVAVAGLNGAAVGLSAGNFHNCALMADGGVMCWGDNRQGQLGVGDSSADRPTPTDVLGLSSGVVAVGAGTLHTCALTEAGGVTCWGYNEDGQLGDGSTTERRAPAPVTGLASGVFAIDAGASHTCAMITGDGVKCWGMNQVGQLGDGSLISPRTAPVSVIGLRSREASPLRVALRFNFASTIQTSSISGSTIIASTIMETVTQCELCNQTFMPIESSSIEHSPNGDWPTMRSISARV